jgi:hypothetical protein
VGPVDGANVLEKGNIICSCRDSNTMPLRTALLWVITQRVAAVSYRRFEATICLKRYGIDTLSPETSVRNHHYSLRNNTEERSFRVLRGGSLKPRTVSFVP